MKKLILSLVTSAIILSNTGFVFANDTNSNVEQVENIYAVNGTIIFNENKQKSKDELLDKKYYNDNSGWEETFNGLNDYIGNNDPNTVFKELENKSNSGNGIEPDDELAMMFYKDLVEEEYVVDLINQNSKAQTTIDNWEYNLNFLKENYDAIAKNNAVDIQLIDAHIESYSFSLLTKDMPDYKEMDTSKSLSISTYIDKFYNILNNIYIKISHN